MLVSHNSRFILFKDPLGACPWISSGLAPWLDQPVAPDIASSGEVTLFDGMTPKEAELAFDIMALDFHRYARIALVRNPYSKMSELYDRIAATDRIWQLRRRLGAADPDFGRWLRSTSPDGNGAGHRTSPRWRRFGSWSISAWCEDLVTHVVRAEYARADLIRVFADLGLSPAFGADAQDAPTHLPRRHHYDGAAQALMRDRYGPDLKLYDDFTPDLFRVA